MKIVAVLVVLYVGIVVAFECVDRSDERAPGFGRYADAPAFE